MTEKRWDTDPTVKPATPWDEWNSYAGCWSCSFCGAAAGFGIHHSACRLKPTDSPGPADEKGNG